MEQYISKSALVAEIEKKKKLLPWGSCASQISMECNCKNEVYNEILSLLDTLEGKDVDLDAEFDKYCETLYLIDLENEPYAELFECAKHFFWLGLNAQRKISYVPNIDDSLKELGVDPSSKEAKIFKESYYTAMEKLKAQKGEDV